MWTWGSNSSGQLGDGTNINGSTPVSVKTSSGVTLNGVKAIAAGCKHSLAIKEDGTVRAWGHNFDGQLGDGTQFSNPIPVTVRTSSGATLSGIGAIAAGNNHSLAARQ